ncbi:hypothetical protein ACHAXN_000365 [Cyclotella atomus]
MERGISPPVFVSLLYCMVFYAAMICNCLNTLSDFWIEFYPNAFCFCCGSSFICVWYSLDTFLLFVPSLMILLNKFFDQIEERKILFSACLIVHDPPLCELLARFVDQVYDGVRLLLISVMTVTPPSQFHVSHCAKYETLHANNATICTLCGANHESAYWLSHLLCASPEYWTLLHNSARVLSLHPVRPYRSMLHRAFAKLSNSFFASFRAFFAASFATIISLRNTSSADKSFFSSLW